VGYYPGSACSASGGVPLGGCGTQNQGVFGRLLAVRQKSDGIA